jgi:hypothetical protein
MPLEQRREARERFRNSTPEQRQQMRQRLQDRSVQ